MLWNKEFFTLRNKGSRRMVKLRDIRGEMWSMTTLNATIWCWVAKNPVFSIIVTQRGDVCWSAKTRRWVCAASACTVYTPNSRETRRER